MSKSLQRTSSALLLLCAASAAFAAEQHGRVKFNGLPVPGATVTALQGDRKLVTTTDLDGTYSLTDLADTKFTLRVEMPCFEAQTKELSPGEPVDWELRLLPLDSIHAVAAEKVTVAEPTVAGPAVPPKPEATKPAPPPPDDLADKASDGFLVNGSVNNAALSPFAQSAAFGNNRRTGRGLYNGSVGFVLDDSLWDAQPFSITGQQTPKPAYYHLQGVMTFGGPLKIPHLLRNGPNFFIGYQWQRDRTAVTQAGLVPTLAQRQGDLASTVIAPSLISPQARALLNLYPLPNFAGSSRYNYQIPVTGATHQDSLQSRLNKTINPKNQISGALAFQSTRADSSNLLNFLDTTDTFGINTNVTWRFSPHPRTYMTLGVQFSRLSTRVTPFFADRQNISGAAGIEGNNQDPKNWGPPALNFSSGFASLTDAQYASNRNQTTGVSYSVLFNRGGHNITAGADYRREQFNYFSQQNPRGSFTFTGAATGSDFADFLLGIPDTSSIAYGNADKYLRSSAYDAYISDDWRVTPEFTVTAGLRWEYGSPATELYGRLVNLAVGPGFSSATPVITGSPLHPDVLGIQPRIGIAWRPLNGSSTIIRAGYGVYRNTSVYTNIALQMAQQPPLSKALSVQNTPANPLTLANGFQIPATALANTFGVDPNLRVGYAQNWTFSIQRDLPGSLVITASYLGIKGTRGLQTFLPNTYPAGAINPCPSCPSGFSYLTSNGNSTRESGSLQVRRRLHNGVTASVQYTFAKAIDDSALGGRGQGGSVIAQDWLNLSAERALSTFDQRHLLSVLTQYTTGMGLGGGTLLTGWRGDLLKEWTFAAQINAGTGMPLTPVYLAAVQGTGVTGSIRPDYTGANLYAAPSGLFLNPAAFTAPAPGHWGNAGRDSITGPGQFTMNASMGRTFRWGDRANIDVRFDATNALNHVTYPSWNTTITSAQFGLPATANPMRSLQSTVRLRF